MTRVVGIGGGHGLATTLRAARLYADDIAAVVTVADDGGSSGRLTRDLGIPPPGDIRRCLCALASKEDVAALYEHRFGSGDLTGHPAGNLIIAALAEMTGDFGYAVRRAGSLLGAVGSVYPATSALVGLHARVDGGVVAGQVAVAQSPAPIRAVYLDPVDPPAHPDAVAAILAADQIVLGPGSLFTSLIATVLVPGIRDALQQTKARRIFVFNTRRQKGETEHLDAAAHVHAVLDHAGEAAVDVVLFQDPEIPEEGMRLDLSSLPPHLEIVGARVASSDGTHEPALLADALRRLV
ncbi:MAG TPA: uridine diphosphate-N-acetylglucosamine-binding protein YvcK [Actinomycetota bacterium]|nr:uridine diphosphate-N-acetylglucosamine-binding protein YvcK [Actinomycetota bacterium]